MLYPSEELIQHVWLHRLFDASGLTTTSGEHIEVLRSGRLNTDAGPDFTDSRLRIGDTLWSGNVEIHVKSSDWLNHGHQNDPSYSNIILHVVFEDDTNEALGSFPTLVLKPHVSDQVLNRYQQLISKPDGLPCGSQFIDVPAPVLTNWIDALLVERLYRKSELMKEAIKKSDGDLEQAFQILLFRSFGMKVNAQPFQQLGELVHWKILAKYQDNLLQLEALVFGVAGFLDSPVDTYQKELKKEFEFLRTKHGLEHMNGSLFKFARMHPKNFPTLRLAQLAALFHKTGQFLQWFSSNHAVLLHQGLGVEPSTYWQEHLNFGKTSSTKGNRIGASMSNNVLINVLVPFLFVLSDRESKPELQQKAFDILETLKPESNTKTRKFFDVGFKCSSAYESQALIELYSNYCQLKKCLSCNIGANILKRET